MGSFKIIVSLLLITAKVQAFATLPIARARCPSSKLLASISPEAEDDDEPQIEYARIRRGGRRREYYDDDDSSYGYNRNKGVYSNDATNYYDDTKETYYMEDDEDDDFDDDEEDDEEYGFFGNAVIPNPLLDSIDPDGAADRFPELASDPRFWIDMLIFVAVLDFLSYIGPRNPMPLDPLF